MARRTGRTGYAAPRWATVPARPVRARARARHRRLAAPLAAVGGLALIPCASAVAGMSPGGAIAALNQIRAAHGIPAGIVENRSWSRGCALHNRYLRLNDLLEHGESAGLRGYTAAGAAAGQSSVLARGSGWAGGRNPWAGAPIHMAQLLAPQLSVTGADDTGGYSCMYTFRGYRRVAAADTLYSFPSNGVGGVAPSETAREAPFAPGDLVGLPQGTPTGPTLYLLPDGPWGAGNGGHAKIRSIVAARLAGPDGPVELRGVTDSMPRIAGYFRGAMLIPVRPLRPASVYRASATLRSASGVVMRRDWSFATDDRALATGRLPAPAAMTRGPCGTTEARGPGAACAVARSPRPAGIRCGAMRAGGAA